MSLFLNRLKITGIRDFEDGIFVSQYNDKNYFTNGESATWVLGACLAIKTSKRNTRDGPGFLGPIKDANPLFFRLTVGPPAPARCPPARPAPVVRLSFVSAPFLRFRRPMLLWRAALFALSFLPLSTLPTRELRSEVSIREHASGFSFSDLRSCFFTHRFSVSECLLYCRASFGEKNPSGT